MWRKRREGFRCRVWPLIGQEVQGEHVDLMAFAGTVSVEISGIGAHRNEMEESW